MKRGENDWSSLDQKDIANTGESRETHINRTFRISLVQFLSHLKIPSLEGRQ